MSYKQYTTISDLGKSVSGKKKSRYRDPKMGVDLCLKSRIHSRKIKSFKRKGLSEDKLFIDYREILKDS